MRTVNELTLAKNDYGSTEEWQNEIIKATMLLANAGYIMVSRLEDFDVFVIEYEYEDKEFGCAYPYWLLPEEYENVSGV